MAVCAEALRQSGSEGEKKMATVIRPVGRPNKFNSKTVKLFKRVVAKFGLRKGQVELARQGVEVCLPTLSKYVASNVAGTPLVLRRGRPKSLTA